MTRSAVGACGWCGQPFEISGGRGPAPTYCSRSHRQRAYEARRLAAAPPAGLEQLAEALRFTRSQVDKATTKAAVVAAYQHLAAAAGTVLGETPARPGLQPVTVTISAGGLKADLPAPSADPDYAPVTLRGLTARQVAAAAELGATTTKTTATFHGHHAIKLEFIRTRAAVERARRERPGRPGKAPMAMERLAAKYEAAITEPNTSR